MNKDQENQSVPEQVKHGVVQTYADDMAKVIEEDRQGLIKKIIHNEEERELTKRLPTESKKNMIFLLCGIVFIAASIAFLSYFMFTRETPPVAVVTEPSSIVFNDTSTSFEISGLSKEKLIQAVYNAGSAAGVGKGEVEGIYLTNNGKSVGLREFMSLIKSTFTPSSSTVLVPDEFLMGVVGGEEAQILENSASLPQASLNKGFFMLIKARSIVDIFDSLRAWEDKMLSELSGPFGFPVNAETNYLLSKEFEDGLIENKNARILYDQSGNIVIMYIFANDNSVIIADSEITAREIMLRLASSEVKK